MQINRIQIGHNPGGDFAAMREAATRSPEDFLRKARKSIDAGSLRLDSIQSFPALYGALRDIPVKITVDDGQYGKRAITTSAFPVLCGDLVVSAFQASYDAVPTISDMLVTEMRDPNKNTWLSHIVPLSIDQDSVKEGDDFPQMTATEEPVMIPSRRQGRMITITRELIDENRVGDIKGMVNGLGEWAAEDVETWTLRKVTDQDSDAYRPNGTAEALYSGTARARTGSGGNLNTSAGLVDYTDLEAARADLTAMKNYLGHRISPRYPLDLVVPDALLYKALRLTQSPFVPEQTTTTLQTSRNEWNLGGKFSTRVISSPKLDDLSTTTWYLGNFDKQFVRKWKFEFEYSTLGEGTESYLRSRIAFQARVAYDCTTGAIDYNRVMANTA